MRRLLAVLACATLVVGSGAPVWANDKAKSGDEPITAMGKRDGRHGGYRDGQRRGRHHRDHDGYRDRHRDDDRGYYRHHRRHRYGYYRDGYGYGYPYDYDGYYGCGYYPDCDPYYGGYYGGRRHYDDRYYYDRYDNCRYRGPRYDYRCDCYHRDTRCDRYSRGRGYYGPYSVDGPELTSPVPDAPAAESPGPQERSNVVANDEHGAAPAPDGPAAESPAPGPGGEPAPEPAPAPAGERKGSPDKTVHPASANPDPNAEPGTGKAKYDRESSDTGEELF